MPTIPIPEQDQLVDVCQREYLMADVQQRTLPAAPVSLTEQVPQYLGTLPSVKDDLQVPSA